MQHFDAAKTASLIAFPELVDAIERAAHEHAAGRIVSPPRHVLALGDRGTMLSMPACAEDIAIHKLVNVHPGNTALGLPTIQGHVSAFAPDTGSPLFMLDGPTVTGRRTAAVTMLAVRTLSLRAPRKFLLIGTGRQAGHHVLAIAACHPDATILVRGSRPDASATFCRAHAANHARLAPCPSTDVPADVDVVVCVTTSRVPVYDEPARSDRLVIGVGAFRPDVVELGAHTVVGSSVYVDEPVGALHEAGDLLQAGIDWTNVRSLADACAVSRAPDTPVVFKSVGTAAWDLAACRVARAALAGAQR